jgi:hypothetical protein
MNINLITSVLAIMLLTVFPSLIFYLRHKYLSEKCLLATIFISFGSLTVLARVIDGINLSIGGKIYVILLVIFFFQYIYLELMQKSCMKLSKVNFTYLLLITLFASYIPTKSWTGTAILPNQDSEVHAVFVGNIIHRNTFDIAQVSNLDPFLISSSTQFYPLGTHYLAVIFKVITFLNIPESLYAVFILSQILWAFGIFILLKRLNVHPTISFLFTLIASTIYEFPFKPIEWGGIPFIFGFSLVPSAIALMILINNKKALEKFFIHIVIFLSFILIYPSFYFVSVVIFLILSMKIRLLVFRINHFFLFLVLVVFLFFVFFIKNFLFLGVSLINSYNFQFNPNFENLNIMIWLKILNDEVLSLKYGQAQSQFGLLNYTLVLPILLISFFYFKLKRVTLVYLSFIFLAFISIVPNNFAGFLKILTIPFYRETERITYILVLPTILILATFISSLFDHFFTMINPFRSLIISILFIMFIFQNFIYTTNKLNKFLINGSTLNYDQLTLPSFCRSLNNNSVILNDRRSQIVWWKAEYNFRVLGSKFTHSGENLLKYDYLINNIYYINQDQKVRLYLNDLGVTHVASKSKSSQILLASEYDQNQINAQKLIRIKSFNPVCSSGDLIIWEVKNF